LVTGPISNLRVIELGTLIAAPFAARLFAEFGADVIKVEPPDGGDPLRTWRKMHNGTSLWWYLQSRNKRCIAIDLRQPEGQEVVRRLVADADVLIENFRPGTLERWGLGWDTLSAINPKLTMVRISGFGQTGPSSGKPGFGAIGEALGGLRYTTGDPSLPPSRMGVSIGDSIASLHAVIGALMSVLNAKTNGGPGQVVDVSLTESVLNMMESLIPEYDLYGHVRERSGAALPGICPSNTYRTRDDKFIVVGGNSDSIFKRLMQTIGREDLANDPVLANNAGRVQHSQLIDGAISDYTVAHDLADVLRVFDESQIPCSPIYSAADIVVDEQFRARDAIVTETLPDGSSIKLPGVFPHLSQTPGQTRWLGPALGAHTDEILTDAGYGAEEVKALRAKKAIA
jgi:crotonobetainyl-CoA:carnitine CoA-transferase CaiB-like acyl-CoA transferase